MASLLDINVLVALAWPSHVHHRAALQWFRAHQQQGWATSPLTESGFVRVSSNQRVIPGARPPQECLLLLRRITELAHHVFWEDDIALTTTDFVEHRKLLGYRQVTDAHLLALALRRGGSLATLDRGIRELVPKGYSPVDVVQVVTETV